MILTGGWEMKKTLAVIMLAIALTVGMFIVGAIALAREDHRSQIPTIEQKLDWERRGIDHH